MATSKSDRSAWWLAVVGVLGAVAGAAVTGVFNYVDQNRDMDAKMIELGVGVLQAQPTSDAGPLRLWAISVIESRAGFTFKPEERKVLVDHAWPSQSSGSTFGLASAPGTTTTPKSSP